MNKKVSIASLMEESGVAFGTSGARGLVARMTDQVCTAYLLAFLELLRERGTIEPGSAIALGGDRRPSTPRILRALSAAAQAAGYAVDYQGLLPSPALVLHGLARRIPSIMVTGSHIPADRNGLKFATPAGEITKADEAGMRRSQITVPDLFDGAGSLRAPAPLPLPASDARAAYLERYLAAFPPRCLAGLRLGVYGHSAVGRELLVELYRTLGAEIVELGFSESFVPVDTEAIRDEDVHLARKWAEEHRLDAIVSTDGDSDRPLLADEWGTWLRGDVLGIHVARYFGADGVATPISCNGALERTGEFPRIERTRIGSPFVIEGMERLAAEGAQSVVGYEANGGFLHASALQVPSGGRLNPLPTRDPVIVHLAVLASARAASVRVSELERRLPARFTASGRDPNFATERSVALLKRLKEASAEQLAVWFELGPMATLNETDGLRLVFASEEVVHLRPSGNAPELRCYAEAETADRATHLVDLGLRVARQLA